MRFVGHNRWRDERRYARAVGYRSTWVTENMDSAIEVYARDKDWTCASWRQLYFLVWRGDATVVRARLANSAFETFIAKQKGKMAGLVVVEPHATPPESDVRPIFANMMRKAGDRVVGLAYVVPHSGFKGAMLRGAITGISLLAREPYPTHVFTKLDESLVWLGSRLYGQTHLSGFVSDADVVLKSLRDV
jgi:hypothetical protein